MLTNFPEFIYPGLLNKFAENALIELQFLLTPLIHTWNYSETSEQQPRFGDKPFGLC